MVAFHSLRVLSSLPESTRAPSGENMTELIPIECPSNERKKRPVAASHSLILSARPESTLAPSGENATEMRPNARN